MQEGRTRNPRAGRRIKNFSSCAARYIHGRPSPSPTANTWISAASTQIERMPSGAAAASQQLQPDLQARVSVRCPVVGRYAPHGVDSVRVLISRGGLLRSVGYLQGIWNQRFLTCGLAAVPVDSGVLHGVTTWTRPRSLSEDRFAMWQAIGKTFQTR